MRPRIKTIRERLALWVAPWLRKPAGIRLGSREGRLRIYRKGDKLMATDGAQTHMLAASLQGDIDSAERLKDVHQRISGTFHVPSVPNTDGSYGAVVMFHSDGTYTRHLHEDAPEWATTVNRGKWST